MVFFILVYIFILADVKYEEKSEEIKRIMKEKDEEIKKKNEEIKKKDEEINNLENDLKEMREENCKLKENFMEIDGNMNSCGFKEIIVFKDFSVENGVLGLERDVYLSIVKFLDSTILRKV
jgi:predicted nuclease with TOPRIM domain